MQRCHSGLLIGRDRPQQVATATDWSPPSGPRTCLLGIGRWPTPSAIGEFAAGDRALSIRLVPRPRGGASEAWTWVWSAAVRAESVFTGTGVALTPPLALLCTSAPRRPVSVQLGLLSSLPPPSPPPRNAPFLHPGCQRTRGFDVLSPAPHPVRFYVTFRRFSNLCPICACAS